MPKKKPYFHNNVEAIREAPDAFFIPVPFDEFMDWKIGGYELPSSCNYIIREQNMKTGKIKEYVYQKPGAAQKKLRQRMESGECEFVVADHDEIHYLRPKWEEDYDDPLA
tara:strand:- start:260 stop:589 length:330 start_codon:yes stop_codon:yes gene_type:complete